MPTLGRELGDPSFGVLPFFSVRGWNDQAVASSCYEEDGKCRHD